MKKPELVPFQEQFNEWMKKAKEKVSFSEIHNPDSFNLPQPESPIDQFDRMTKEGFKLDLIKGEYYK